MKTKYDEMSERAYEAGGERWIAASYGPKTIGIGAPGGPAYMLVRPNHGGMDTLWPLIDHIRSANPVAVLDLIADVRALADALERLQSWAWAMTMSDTPLQTVSGDHPLAQSMAALKRIQGEGK